MISLDEVYKTFPDNRACLIYIFQQRFPDIRCPKCKRSNSFSFNKANRNFVCICGQFSIYPKKGTLFDHSRTDLTKWFLTIYLIANEQHGISTTDLMRKAGIARQTATDLRRKIMDLIYEYTIETINPADILRVKKRILAKHQWYTKERERQYVAEFLFREKYQYNDPFKILLDLAIKHKNSSK